MSYSLVGTGAFATVYDAALTPAIPGGSAAGDLLLMHTGIQQGSVGSSPTISGWTLLSSQANQHVCCLYGRIAQGGDSSPSVDWGIAADVGAVIAAYSGGPASLTGIVAASVDFAGSNLTKGAFYSALTVPSPSCLVVAGAFTNCSTGTSGATWTSFGSFAIRTEAQLITAGGGFNAVMNDWIQTTATNVGSGAQETTIASSSAQNYATYVVALLPGTSGSGSILGVGGPWI